MDTVEFKKATLEHLYLGDKYMINERKHWKVLCEGGTLSHETPRSSSPRRELRPLKVHVLLLALKTKPVRKYSPRTPSDLRVR